MRLGNMGAFFNTGVAESKRPRLPIPHNRYDRTRTFVRSVNGRKIPKEALRQSGHRGRLRWGRFERRRAAAAGQSPSSANKPVAYQTPLAPSFIS